MSEIMRVAMGQEIADLREQLEITHDALRVQKEQIHRLQQSLSDALCDAVVAQQESIMWQRIAGKLYNPWTHMDGVEDYSEAIGND
jgi:hypothetical protein